MNGLRRPTLAEQEIIDMLVRHPHKLPRILTNQIRANACAGGCGRPVWGEQTLCRKCERKQRRGK